MDFLVVVKEHNKIQKKTIGELIDWQRCSIEEQYQMKNKSQR